MTDGVDEQLAAYEASAQRWHELRGDVAEAGDLCILRGQVRNGVTHQVGEIEPLPDLSVREVPDRHADRVRARLRA